MNVKSSDSARNGLLKIAIFELFVYTHMVVDMTQNLNYFPSYSMWLALCNSLRPFSATQQTSRLCLCLCLLTRQPLYRQADILTTRTVLIVPIINTRCSLVHDVGSGGGTISPLFQPVSISGCQTNYERAAARVRV